MTIRNQFAFAVRSILGAALLISLPATLSHAATDNVNDIVARSGQRVVAFLDQFSEVKCSEQVRQEKLGKDGKVEVKEDSSYDYLVILSNPSGELSLNESRLAVRQAKADKKNRALLVTNGFATLFLVFHPYYADSFKFSLLPDDDTTNRRLRKVSFEHIRGTRSPAALSLRSKEYPLELSGVAWIDPENGSITRINAGIANTMEDVGLRTLHTEIEYAVVPFRGLKDSYWFPANATVEVETPRQHWRNTHHFSDYKRFAVDTEEQVAKQ